MKNRDRNEIIGSILLSVKNAKERDGIGITRIMYDSFLTHGMVTHYLKLLTKNGSLEHDEPNKTYRITDKGLQFLELQSKISDMLEL